MGELVAVPVTGDEVTGPGEGMEIHIYSIDGKMQNDRIIRKPCP